MTDPEDTEAGERAQSVDESDESPTGHREAHERLSTGALARWERACATHPWRVILSWIGIVVVLIVLVGSIGGLPRGEFEVPRAGTQKGADPLQAGVAPPQGPGPELPFAAPPGPRLPTPGP